MDKLPETPPEAIAEIEKLWRTILAALDCLHHDDRVWREECWREKGKRKMTDVKTMHAHLVVLGGLMVRLQVLPDKPEYSHETQPSYLLEFARGAIDLAPEMPIDKLGRWVGYIQGVMAARNWLHVPSERAWTRPVFTGNGDEK